MFVSSLLDHGLGATVALSDYEKGAIIPGIKSGIELSAVYGTYVIGSDWRCMVLQRKQYTISRDYSALSDEVFDILPILKGLNASPPCKKGGNEQLCPQNPAYRQV